MKCVYLTTEAIDTIDENKKVVWCLNAIMAATAHVRLLVAVVSTSEWK